MFFVEQSNKIGAVTAIVFFCSAILVFTAKLTGWLHVYYWSAIAEFCLIIPLILLIVNASRQDRPINYYIKIELMLAWLVLELILSYVLDIDFRVLGWAVAGYVILFFAGCIGMMSICFQAGRKWGILSVILFIVMSVLVFLQGKAVLQ